MNPAKCDDFDYIHFLIAAQKAFTCSEASRLDNLKLIAGSGWLFLTKDGGEEYWATNDLEMGKERRRELGKLDASRLYPYLKCVSPNKNREIAPLVLG